MGLYFRKRIKILPGVHMNVSKSGTSWSIGPRGAKVNFGKRGTYVTTGIPGTGIYSRTKVCNNNMSNHRTQLNNADSGYGKLLLLNLVLVLLKRENIQSYLKEM